METAETIEEAEALLAPATSLEAQEADYERFVEAITYQDGRCYADARGPKDLYSEDVESMGLFGAVISKMEVRKMQRRMRSSQRASSPNTSRYSPPAARQRSGIACPSRAPNSQAWAKP